jgi:hypothetical protein
VENARQDPFAIHVMGTENAIFFKDDAFRTYPFLPLCNWLAWRRFHPTVAAPYPRTVRLKEIQPRDAVPGSYVSFVTYGRNDGYTPGYIKRVTRATACLAIQLERASVDSEIIITDWNPPADRPLLIESIELPKALRHVSIRGIVVPAEHHYRYAGSHERGIHAGEAADVGMRRARGRFITTKASDTFFSNETIAMIARHNLDPDAMYRIDRHDIAVDDDSIWELDVDALLARFAALSSQPHSLIQQSSFWQLRDLHTNACGDFTLMSAAYWHLLRGHVLDTTVLSLDIDSIAMHAAAGLGVREVRWPAQCKVFKPMHGNLNSVRVIQAWRPWQRKLDRFLFQNVGARTAHWARVTFDYPRRRVRGVDSVLGPSIERNFVAPAGRWARGELPLPTRPENWGLSEVALEERSLCQASWEAPADA